jgi:hypothetical protein
VLLVVHIPKTAGTSLRKALVGHFPEQIFSLVRHRHIPGAD